MTQIARETPEVLVAKRDVEFEVNAAFMPVFYDGRRSEHNIVFDLK
jgi:hypothetical protein